MRLSQVSCVLVVALSGLVFLSGCWLWPTDPPFPEARKLVVLRADEDGGAGGDCLTALSKHRSLFQSVAAFATSEVALGAEDEREQVRVLAVSDAFFSTLGLQPALGRAFLEGHSESSPVVLLSHELWQDRYAGEPEALGEAPVFDERPTTIVGVLSKNVSFPTATAGFDAVLRLADILDGGGLASTDLSFVARLREEVSPESAAEAVAELGEEGCSGLSVVPLLKSYFAGG